MKIVGMSYAIKDDGTMLSTLHVLEPFAAYFNEGNRHAEGQAVESIYVGNIDVSGLKLGDEIEVFYGRAHMTRNGRSYQPVVKVEVLK